MYDLIGDIHGHAEELLQLLEVLGYRKSHGVYRHQGRQVIFLGDFIDRGPQIPQVLQVVRSMLEAGQARAIIGNHEFNALAYHTADPDSPGEYLRSHTPEHARQLRKTVAQLAPQELQDSLEWFRTLPLCLDLDGLRVVHACWDDRAVNQTTQGLAEHGGITDAFLHSAGKKSQPLFTPVDVILKGKEAPLPGGMSFFDREGHERREIRTRWYLSPEGQTYRTYALQTDDIPCDLPLEKAVCDRGASYPATAKPVFFGHYWLMAPRPALLADNVACLDYSVTHGGFLCAYRWNGEPRLTNEHFVWVPARA